MEVVPMCQWVRGNRWPIMALYLVAIGSVFQITMCCIAPPVEFVLGVICATVWVYTTRCACVYMYNQCLIRCYGAKMAEPVAVVPASPPMSIRLVTVDLDYHLQPNHTPSNEV